MHPGAWPRHLTEYLHHLSKTSRSQPFQSFETHPPEPGLPQAEAGTCRSAPLLPKASRESLLPLATEDWAALPGCEMMAPSAQEAGGAPRPRRSRSGGARSSVCSPAARHHPAQAPDFQVPRLRLDVATQPPGMMALWGSWREQPHADTTTSWCCGPRGTDGPLPPQGQGKGERCQAPPACPSPRAGESSAKPAQTFLPFAMPTAAVPGAREPTAP